MAFGGAIVARLYRMSDLNRGLVDSNRHQQRVQKLRLRRSSIESKIGVLAYFSIQKFQSAVLTASTIPMNTTTQSATASGYNERVVK